MCNVKVIYSYICVDNTTCVIMTSSRRADFIAFWIFSHSCTICLVVSGVFGYLQHVEVITQVMKYGGDLMKYA